MTIRKLTKDTKDLFISIQVEFDRDHDYDRTAYEKGFGESVRDMINRFGDWGWCVVTVQARFVGLTGTTHLGGCSYESEADFRAGEYYEQMVDEAIDDLQIQADRVIHAMLIV